MVRDHLNNTGSIQEFEDADGAWNLTRAWMMQTASLLLAFCHVTDLTTCGDLSFARSYHGCTFSRHLFEWNHRSPILIAPDVWFRMIIQRMDADLAGQDDAAQRKSHISKRGSSIFINTLGLLDPSNLPIEGIGVLAGVPVNDGIVKHCITDRVMGFDSSIRYGFSATMANVDFSECLIPVTFLWVPCLISFEIRKLSFADTVFGKAKVARPLDRFIVQLRINYISPVSINSDLGSKPDEERVVSTG